MPLDVTVGLRGDFWQALNASVLTVNSSTNNVGPQRQRLELRSAHRPEVLRHDELTLRAAVYRNFSAPGMNQMYRSFASGTAYTAINPNLQPMTNFGQEVGFDFKWREFTLSGTYFNNNLDNFIDFVTVCNTNAACAAPFITAAGLSPAFTTVNQYNNVGNATFQGFEIIGGPGSRCRAAQVDGELHQHHRLSDQHELSRRWCAPASSSARCRLRCSTPASNGGRSGTGPHRQPEVVPGLLERHRPHPAERGRHADRPRRAPIRRPRTSTSMAASRTSPTSSTWRMGYTTTSFEGPTVNATAIPALGMPLTAIVGMRVRF